jgi:hypothetical protein
MLTLPPLEHFVSELASHDLTVLKTLGLTTKEEQIWCNYFCRQVYQNNGEIVELGPWLGSLTIEMQKGLAQNPAYLAKSRPLQCYDRFVWEPWCEDIVKDMELAGTIPNGESFMPAFLSRVEHADVPVSAHTIDLEADYTLPSEIEFLLNDALKSWTATYRFAAYALPRVIEGGCVAHQDFLWPTEAFLVPLMYVHREQFSGHYVVPGSCMAIFSRLPTSTSDPEPAGQLPNAINDMNPAFINNAFRWVESNLSGIDSDILHLCEATLNWLAGNVEASHSIVAKEQLSLKAGSPLFEFQRDILRQWGYTEMLSAE